MKREEAIKILDDVIPPPNHATVDLDHLPIAQAWWVIKNELKQQKGKWINSHDSQGNHYKRCSECGAYVEATFFANDYSVNFCPNCGADMRGEENVKVR